MIWEGPVGRGWVCFPICKMGGRCAYQGLLGRSVLCLFAQPAPRQPWRTVPTRSRLPGSPWPRGKVLPDLSECEFSA